MNNLEKESTNLEKVITNKNKQFARKNTQKNIKSFIDRRQSSVESAIAKVKANTIDKPASSIQNLKKHIEETKQRRQAIEDAKSRYEDYINFANTYQKFPVTYTNENGENVTVVQTENGPIFKTEHHTPQKNSASGGYDDHIESITTYEGFHITHIKDKPQIVYSCFTNTETEEYNYGMHGDDFMPVTNLITGVTRSKTGKFELVETERFGKHNYLHPIIRPSNGTYNREISENFTELENSFNVALAQHNADMDIEGMGKEL